MYFRTLILFLLPILVLAQQRLASTTDSWKIHNITLYYGAAKFEFPGVYNTVFANETSIRFDVVAPQSKMVYMCTGIWAKTSKPDLEWITCNQSTDPPANIGETGVPPRGSPVRWSIFDVVAVENPRIGGWEIKSLNLEMSEIWSMAWHSCDRPGKPACDGRPFYSIAKFHVNFQNVNSSYTDPSSSQKSAIFQTEGRGYITCSNTKQESQAPAISMVDPPSTALSPAVKGTRTNTVCPPSTLEHGTFSPFVLQTIKITNHTVTPSANSNIPATKKSTQAHVCTFSATLLDPNAIDPKTRSRPDTLTCNISWPCSSTDRLAQLPCDRSTRPSLNGTEPLSLILDLSFYQNKPRQPAERNIQYFSILATRRELPFENVFPVPSTADPSRTYWQNATAISITAGKSLGKGAELVPVEGKGDCESSLGCEFRGKEKEYTMGLLDFDDVSLI